LVGVAIGWVMGKKGDMASGAGGHGGSFIGESIEWARVPYDGRDRTEWKKWVGHWGRVWHGGRGRVMVSEEIRGLL
jgi:hypothetical protein